MWKKEKESIKKSATAFLKERNKYGIFESEIFALPPQSNTEQPKHSEQSERSSYYYQIISPESNNLDVVDSI